MEGRLNFFSFGRTVDEIEAEIHQRVTAVAPGREYQARYEAKPMHALGWSAEVDVLIGGPTEVPRAST